MKNIVANFALVGMTILVFLGVCELGLRLLPVDEGLFAQPVSEKEPIFRFQSNQQLTWSRGPTFDLVNNIRVNNVGFVNDQSYHLERDRRLIAVVGDSQVEAAMVPYAETLHARLGMLTGEEVYSFAASGAPLSQYVVWAQHAKEYWGAEFLVIVVVGNDFDESLMKYKMGPGFHHYAEGDNGNLLLRRVDYAPSRLRKFVKYSALARYLLFNVKVLALVKKLTSSLAIDALAQNDEFSGNTSTSTNQRRVELSKLVSKTFLRDLRKIGGWSPENVVFVVDGFRYPAARTGNRDGYFGLMRRYFMKEARTQKFGIVDMDDEFFPNFESFAERFEFPTDGHWNEHSHFLAAKAIIKNIEFNNWINQPPPN